MNARSRCLLFALLLGLTAGCGSPFVAAPSTPRTYRIGYFGNGGDPRTGPLGVAFVEELGGLGYLVDQNLTIAYRWTDGRSERLPELARELSGMKLDAVFASGDVPAQALLEVDADVPIVMST